MQLYLPEDPTSQDITQHVQDALDEREKQNNIATMLTPNHAHTGADSSQVSAANLIPYPVVSTIPTDTAIEGTVVFYNSGSTYTIYVRMNKTWQAFGQAPATTYSAAEINLSISQIFGSFSLGRGFAFNAKDGTATRMMMLSGTHVFTFRNFAGNRGDAWHLVSDTTVGTTMYNCICYHNGAFYGVSNAQTSVYKFTDSDTPSQTLCTLSGASLTTAITIASDGSRIFIVDGTTACKTFTQSGTTLTYFSTITLANAVDNGMMVNPTNIYSSVGGGSSPITIYKFDTAGTLVTSISLLANANGYSPIKAIGLGPDGGLWTATVFLNASNVQSGLNLKKLTF